MPAHWLGRILITTDLSPSSEAAFLAVRPLAESLESAMTLLHVREPLSADESAGRGASADIQAQLDEMRLRLLGRDALARTSIIEANVVWKAICDYARDHEYGLIAISARGSTDAPGEALGNVAVQVVHAAPCPVLCVQPERPSSGVH